MSENILAIIPARGGSKGFAGKNLKLLGGHPLVGWAVASAMESSLTTRIICSTDDPDIADAARCYGAETPFMRPAEISQDDTRDLPVFQHAISWLAEHDNWHPSIVIHLRPTSPLRPPGLVDQAVRLLSSDPRAGCVRGVCLSPCTPYKMWILPKSGQKVPYMSPLLVHPVFQEAFNEPRQELPPVWWQIGAVDAIRTTTILSGSMTGSAILPLQIHHSYAVDIDDYISLMVAENLLSDIHCVTPDPIKDRS